MSRKNYEKYSNGLEVIYAYGYAENLSKKKVVFLAGTTAWNSDLLKYSWRRKFLQRISQESKMEGIVICVPEPQSGVFGEHHERSLIDWENEYLNLSTVHVFWLNMYWTYEQAIHACSEISEKFYTDGKGANIGITVRNEIGASFTRLKYEKNDFSLVVGAPYDAQGMNWINTHSKILNLPIHILKNKRNIIDDKWYSDILTKLK